MLKYSIQSKYSLNKAFCRYEDSGHDSLYSLKWYKDEVEFYRLENIRDLIMISEDQQTLRQVSALEQQRERKSI